MLYVAMLLLGILAALPTKASPTITVYIEPKDYIFDTGTVSTGYKFNVTVWIKSDEDLNMMTFQVGIRYDHRYINVTELWGEVTGSLTYRAWPNDNFGGRDWDPEYVFYGKTGHTIGNPVYYYNAPNQGEIMLGATLTKDITLPANTPKKLACFEFVVTAMPPKGVGQYVDSVLNIDNDDTYLLSGAGMIPGVTRVDGYYKLTWTTPPPARLNIVRSDGKPWPIVFEKWWHQVGQTFVASVYIEDLSAAWGIVGANFTLTYDSTLISTDATNVTIDTLWTDFTIDDSVPGALFIEVKNPSEAAYDKVHVADITFTVIRQGTYPEVDTTELTFSQHCLWDHVMLIPTKTPGKGVVVVEGYLAIPLAYFEVYPKDTYIGPAPSVGKTFKVQVKINNLYSAWFVVAWQCRLFFDPTIIEFVEAEEGPFLKDPLWNKYGTIFASNVFLEPGPYPVVPFPGPHVAIGCLLLPNPATGGYDQEIFPNTTIATDNTLATVTFRVVAQKMWPENLTCILGLTGLSDWLLDKNGKPVPVDEERTINGTCTIRGSPLPGRIVDVYGGANNAGHGVVNAPFPEPYGGQGPNSPMDLVIPQSEVYLFAKVTYNFWPVQSKLVNFEIEGPYVKNEITGELVKKPSHKVWAKLSAVTNGSGIASIVFRMPWVCDDPWNNVTGIWKVTTTCNLYDRVVTDTMIFYYEDLVKITKVTTDKYSYAHGENVNVTVKYATYSMQKYNALFAITVTDEVGVSIAMVLKTVEVGGAQFCELATGSFTVELEIPKWAAAGYAYVHVNCYDKDPTEGGFAWCPEYTPPPEIFIMPV